MIFLFTKSNTIGSKLIRWGLDDEVSHFALIDTRRPSINSMVLHSTLKKGVHITGIRQFLQHNEVVYAWGTKGGTNKEHMQYFSRLHTALYRKDYDIKGVSFLAASVIVCIKVLGTELPSENKWADKKDFYCSEVLHETAFFLGQYSDIKLDTFSKQMLTPGRALQLFKKDTRLISLTKEVNSCR